jgi:hypothetical protein
VTSDDELKMEEYVHKTWRPRETKSWEYRICEFRGITNNLFQI